jgi:Invasion associated locus B (IalB) protein
MRTIIVCLTALALSPCVVATAAPHRLPAHPADRGAKAIGTFGGWTAATYEPSGHAVCYAFTRALTSMPPLPGRGQVVLMVTQRPDQRDSVAIEAGFDYAPKAVVTVQVDQTGLDFYTAQHNAFARDGKTSVTAFQRGDRAIARSPGPHGHQVTDTFSLNGFSAAYAAVDKACPPRK